MEFYCGQRFVTREVAQHIFEQPPATITTQTSDDQVSVYYFGFYGDGRWTTAVNYLMSSGDADLAREIVRSVAVVEPNNPEARNFSQYLFGPQQNAPAELNPNPGLGMQTPPMGTPGLQTLGAPMVPNIPPNVPQNSTSCGSSGKPPRSQNH
jgi:hypothetical protein